MGQNFTVQFYISDDDFDNRMIKELGYIQFLIFQTEEQTVL